MRGAAGRSRALDAGDLPLECWVHIGTHLPMRERLRLAEVSKQLFAAVRHHGAPLFESLQVRFSGGATLASFRAWLQRCTCCPHALLLQQSDGMDGMDDGDEPPVLWDDITAAVQRVLPSLKMLLIRFDGEATAGPWLLPATKLSDLALYCTELRLESCLAQLTQLRDLSVESTDMPLQLAPGCLPSSLVKIFAVESRLAEVPEAFSRLTSLESLYLSRNPLAPASLDRLRPLKNLRLLSLIGSWFEGPPAALSALTSLKALYLDYNSFGVVENNAVVQEEFAQALAPLTGLQALGLSHNLLDSWPDVVDRLPQLAVLYLESNPGIIRLPATAAATLARLRVLSCDATVLFMNTELLTAAVRLQHLFISGCGLMWTAPAEASQVGPVLECLARLPKLKTVTFVVQTQREEAPSVGVVELMLRLPRRLPQLTVEALDSESFFGVTLSELDMWAMQEQQAASQALMAQVLADYAAANGCTPEEAAGASAALAEAQAARATAEAALAAATAVGNH